MSITALEHNSAVERLACRVELACATVELCDAYRGMLLRRWEAEGRGEAMDLEAHAAMIREHYIDNLCAFLTAWQRGSSAVENMRVIEVAVHGYADRPDVDEQTRAAGERMFLDFMRKAVWRAPAMDGAAVDTTATDAAMGDLEGRLEALLLACKAAGGKPRDPATTAAIGAVGGVIGSALQRGYEAGRLQVALDWWATATGGPQINVSVGASEE
jgi:hypothetical protein